MILGEMFFCSSSSQLLQPFENPSSNLLLSGPPSGKTSLFQFAFNVALRSDSNNKVIFICNHHRYVNDDEDIRKYFAAFHLYDTLPAAVLIDDFGDFFDDKICQQRYSNPRGRDMAMVKTLALCHNAITFANQKGSCKVLLSDTHTHQRDSPRFHFIYKKWIQTTFTIKEGDVSGSFILKDRSHSLTDHTTTIKAAKYSIALQYLVFDGIVEDQL